MGEYLERRTSAMMVYSLDTMSKTIIKKQERIESLERQLNERDELIVLMQNGFMAAQGVIISLQEVENLRIELYASNKLNMMQKKFLDAAFMSNMKQFEVIDTQHKIIKALSEKNIELQAMVDQLETTVKKQHDLYCLEHGIYNDYID